MGYRRKCFRQATRKNSPRVVVAFLVAGALWTLGPVGAQAQTPPSTTTPTGRCATGPCPLNVGGTFVWHAADGSASGHFTGSLVLFPRMGQASCTAVADADTSRPQTVPTPGGPPHPGLMVPFPFTVPGPGKPLTAFIDIATYHGSGTYTQTSLAHQTYIYPAGSQYSTAPAESPGAAWSVTLDPDGSGHLTYSGPAQHTGPGVPPSTIQLSMSWMCNDRATPVGVAQATTTPGSTPSGQPANHPSNVNVVVIVVAAVLLLAVLAILGGVLRARRRQTHRPPCSCSAAISVSGPSQIGISDCARPAHWVINGNHAAEVLEGDGIEGRHVTAVLHAECTGGGTAEVASVAWSVRQTDAGHLSVTAEARIVVHCQGEQETEVIATGDTVVNLVVHPCCGPDITDVFLATVNRTFDRLAADRPFSPTVFMVANGFRMICRPLPPGTFTPGGCPSSQPCADTVTIVGRCVDCFVPDNFLFGAVAGWLDLPVAEMTVMGWGAKLTKSNLEVLPGHVISEKLWNEGHALGLQAHSNRHAGRPYHLDRVALERALRVSQNRDDCGNCAQPAATPFFIDFGREPWH
jgi:hypothetical protein